MSLINDALKRAKQAQLHAPPPTAPGPQLRPCEPARETGRRSGLMMPAITVAGVALVLLFAWRLFLKGGPAQSPPALSQPPAVAIAVRPTPPAPSLVANTAPALAVPTAPRSQPAAGQPVGPEPPAEASASSAVNSKAAAASSTTNAAGSGTTVSSVPDSVAADAPAASEKPPAPKPAPLKLQGILFHPAHPAVMIGGKTLVIGDKLGEWRVVAISQESATLVNACQTNLLTLPQ